MKLPRFVIKRSCPNFVITLTPIGNKEFPDLWYSFAPICNKLMLKLVFFAISRVPWTTTTKLRRTIKQYALTLLCYWWWNSSNLGHVTKFYGFISISFPNKPEWHISWRSFGELFVKERGWYSTSNLYICGGGR